jgi:hypothetical protein
MIGFSTSKRPRRGRPPALFFNSLNQPYWADIQACSAQQSCDIIFGQARNIVLNLNRSFRFIEGDSSHAVYFTDAAKR